MVTWTDKRCYAGMPVWSQHDSQSVVSEDAESVASQLQPVKSAELLAHESVIDLDTLQGGSMMALPQEHSKSPSTTGYAPCTNIAFHEPLIKSCKFNRHSFPQGVKAYFPVALFVISVNCAWVLGEVACAGVYHWCFYTGACMQLVLH